MANLLSAALPAPSQSDHEGAGLVPAPTDMLIVVTASPSLGLAG